MRDRSLAGVGAALAGPWHQLGRNRWAVAGGLGGLALAVIAAVAALAWRAEHADATPATADDDPFEVDFAPGTLARLGEPLDPHTLPPKIVVQDRRAPDAAPPSPAAAVATDADAEPLPTVPEPSAPRPRTPPDDRDPRIPIGPKPTRANTLHPDDPPTADHDDGNPFGDPQGWDDRLRDGDPWATEVMKRLTNMGVGWYAGRAEAGDFRFGLTICKDGHVEQVRERGGSLSEDGRKAVRLALETVRLPEIPAELAAVMPGDCAKLRYTFVWTADGVQ